MKKFYQMTGAEVFKNVHSSEDGLTSKEAEHRIIERGENVLKEKNKKSAIKILLSQFKNMMVLLLLLVGIVSLVFSLVNGESIIEFIVIYSCIIINVIMGFIQEMKSENAIEALKNLTTSKVQVKRDGVWVEIDAKRLVVGDVILLDAGDKVPADARVIKCVNAQVDESVLTGESISVEKEDVVLEGEKLIQDRKNIVFSGTSVVNGKIEAVVVATGMDTELGLIAGNLDKNEEVLTPIQLKVKKVSSIVTVIACVLVALTFCYGLIMKKDALSIIMLCISMILASVPEVLPVSITATLTIGVNQMSKRKTIVKQLAAIETLGATQIICSDKTGTITTNQMTLVEIYTNGKSYRDVKKNDRSLAQIQNVLALCNDNEIDVSKEGEFIGDPVEVALSKYLYNLGLSLNKFREDHERVAEIPFDSNRKMMSTINRFDDGNYMLTKGSLGEIITRCKKIYKNGKIVKMSRIDASRLLVKERQMSRKAYKVLAFAFKEVGNKKNFTPEDENDLVMVGIVGLVDPPKDGVKEAVLKCKHAKMTPIMITGDSLETALAVAVDVGIARDSSQGIEGKKIDGLTDDQLVSFVKKYTVFARVTPEHKVRIVRAFQAAGKVVAMTGDGVNDAPALKLAHVGIGMGRAGTDVTKNVADIILMDDSFSTIVTAVEEGRRIYNNVVKTIFYNLSSNFAEIFLIIVGMILLRDIISPLHILYIDIVADTIPSIALAFEKNAKNEMRKKPYGLNRRLFTPFSIFWVVGSAIIEAGISLGIFFVSEAMFGHEVAMTLTLLSIVLTELTFAYNCKDLKDFSHKKGLFDNKVMNTAALVLFLIQIPVFFTPIGSVFGLVIVTIPQFLAVIGAVLFGYVVLELLKRPCAKVFKDK